MVKKLKTWVDVLGGCKLASSILKIAEEKFQEIRTSNLNDREKLNESQRLRDHLRQTYQMTSGRIKYYQSIQVDLNVFINQIDAYWWELFTKGTKASG